MAERDECSTSKRQQIIAGAEIVFTECGYEGASMSRIALRASVSKGTLYNYFTSKSELFAAFVRQKAATLLEVFEPFDDQGDLEVILGQIARQMVAQILSPGSLVLHRIVISEAARFPHLAEIFWDAGPQPALAHMADLLTSRMRTGDLRQADPQVAAGQFFALCQTRVAIQRRLQIVQVTGDDDIELVVQGAVRLFLKGYGAVPLAPPPLATAGAKS